MYLLPLFISGNESAISLKRRSHTVFLHLSSIKCPRSFLGYTLFTSSFDIFTAIDPIKPLANFIVNFIHSKRCARFTILLYLISFPFTLSLGPWCFENKFIIRDFSSSNCCYLYSTNSLKFFMLFNLRTVPGISLTGSSWRGVRLI